MELKHEIRQALETLRQVQGVKHCWFEDMGHDIFYVYTIIAPLAYEIQRRVFDEYGKIEKHYPRVSFEFHTTSLSMPPNAEIVF